MRLPSIGGAHPGPGKLAGPSRPPSVQAGGVHGEKDYRGNGDLWVTEYTITYGGRPATTVSIMEFRDGKVFHETQYFADPFEAPAWRSQWVERIA
jgi:hypothetical protein